MKKLSTYIATEKASLACYFALNLKYQHIRI